MRRSCDQGHMSRLQTASGEAFATGEARGWIRDHGEAYAGRWVALRDYELVAAADSFTELARQIPPSVDVLVTVIE